MDIKTCARRLMKNYTLFIFLIILSPVFYGQTIRNNSFEISLDAPKVAKDWNVAISKPNGKETFGLPPGFVATLDDKFSRSGKYSLKMFVPDSTNFVMGATQRCNIKISSPTSIRIVAWVKTKDCKEGAAINCTQLDSEGKTIGYTSSRQQATMVMNTQDWTKTEIIVLLRPEVKSLDIMTYFYGSGTVWFDDVTLSAMKGKATTAPIVAAYLDSVIKVVKKHSLYKDSINWKTFTKQVKDLSSGMQTYKQAGLLGNYIVNELKVHGDNHSFLMTPVDVKEFGTADVMGMGRKVETEYLGDGVGYVVMPGFASMNDSIRKAFASYAQDMIKKTDTENKICSWIVDLRYDNGGSCPPMVAGLGPILGDGVFDRNISENNDTTVSVYENGVFYMIQNGRKDNDLSMTIPNPYKIKNGKAPVAVLIGPRCGSSGECAVAAFIGRQDTKLFGQPTAGYTKGNDNFKLPDGSILFLSAAIQTDRNGKKYPDRIYPDVEVVQPAESKTDVTLERAKQWLVSFGICK